MFDIAGEKGSIISMVREIKENELNELMNLSLYLHEKSIPQEPMHLLSTWNEILGD